MFQRAEDASEESMETDDPLDGDTGRYEEQREASFNHSRPRYETPRPYEHGADRTTLPYSPESHVSPQFFRCWHESSQISEIEDFIYESAQTSALESQLFIPDDADCGAWVSTSYPKCPASFGDHGTTATAGAFGQLIQFSNYLGAGNSGMFSAGHCFIEEPYFVNKRARNLHSFASEAFEQAQTQHYSNLFGLKFWNLAVTKDARPSLKWFQYQWPRYEYKRGCFEGMEHIGLTIQFIVRHGTVFQQCILENWGDTDVELEFLFCKGMRIWDLDHVTDDYKFNQTTPTDQNAGPGPGGFGWVHVNQFRKGSPVARPESQQSSHASNPSSSHGTRNKKDDPNYGVALVVSMAVDGKMIQFSPGQSPRMFKQTLKARSSTSGHRFQKLEIVTAYKLVLLENALSDWKTFTIPLKEMDPSRFLGEARTVSLLHTPLTRISGKDDLAYSNDKWPSETPKGEENKSQAGTVEFSQNGVAAFDSEPQTQPSPAIHESMTEKTSPIMDHIEFSVRRNLEHILGVCAVPVASRIWGEKAEGGIVWEKLRDVQPIALTCGDLSGHRICTTASFFAFQFLAEVAKRLRRQPDGDDTHAQSLLSRIRDVCLGHLKWLYAAQKTDPVDVFVALYWVSGEAVTVPESSDSWVPLRLLGNTAFQILKALEFANTYNEDKDADFSLVGEMISQWGRGWVRRLERSVWRGSLVWKHKGDEGLKVFRLDDHVWKWRALKAMEDKRLGAWGIMYDKAQRKERSSSTDSETSDADETLRRSRKYSSQSFQRDILRKFTTDHDTLRKKMVALTRSPRETRFLFHARDTALLYGQDMGFFDEDPSFREDWKNTIDAQRFHENNQEAWWDNALRYALSIMLGVKGHQINNREPGDMVRAATEVLLRSSSENGLFPGKLDIVTKGPLGDVFHTEEDADSYYAAGFEIPYIFLIHAKEIGAIFDDTAEPALETTSGKVNLRHYRTDKSPNSTEAMPAHHTSNPQEETDQRQANAELRRLLERLSDVISARPFLPNTTSASDYSGSKEPVVGVRLALKKAIPFGNIVEPQNIVEIEDEWLFRRPHFFDAEVDENNSMDKTLDSLRDSEAAWLKNIDVAEMRWKYSSQNREDGRASIQSEASGSSITTERSMSSEGPEDSGFLVMDMPTRKRIRGKAVKNVLTSHEGPFEYIWDHIRMPRPVEAAKKRIIMWSNRGTDSDLEAALLCYAASRNFERDNMRDFFERHFRHQNFMFNNCDVAYNHWETEVHLSFFNLKAASAPLSSDAARHVEGFPGVQGKHISRGSIGFRFQGDAFDRYWTCHRFSNQHFASLKSKDDGLNRLWVPSDSLWFQRKILEVMFFCLSLQHVESKTQEIFSMVKFELGIKSGAYSWLIPSMDKYSSWSKLWQGFEPLLQALVDDLTSAQDIIGQWEAREGGRGQERPRWTLNDERKYRADISRCERVLQRRKKEIQDLLSDIESVRDACTALLANAREELSFHSSQNIASFTYVTIVFLPLGFAASVFSMNGYPSGGWVASMAVIAVVTLAITATALANTKLLLAVAERFSSDALRLTGAVFQSSLIGKEQQRRRDERAQASPEPSQSAHQGEQKRGDLLQSHSTRHVLFWMAYLLIELPARRVAIACRALPGSLMQSLGLSRPDATPSSPVDSTDESYGPPAPTSVPAPAFGRKLIRITGGILILPLLLISWTTQLLFYNVLDILTFLGWLARKNFYALVAPSDPNGATTDTRMVTWLIEPPPSLRPIRKLIRRAEESEKLFSQASSPVSSATSSSSSLEGV